MHVDYLIIGQGIAGSLFAHELNQHNQTFIVIDQGAHNASKTAAGIYNPVVLKRFTPVWHAQQQIQVAQNTFAQLSQALNLTLDYPTPICRIFHDAMEKSTWLDKSTRPDLAPYLGKTHPAGAAALHTPNGVGEVKLSGRIDVKGFLSAMKAALMTNAQLRIASFDYAALTPIAQGWRYHDITAQHVVFCEGFGIKDNPFFNTLPLQGNKGEVLRIYAPKLNLTTIAKGGIFIAPLPEVDTATYFVGATYNWTDKDEAPSASAKEALQQKLNTLIKVPYGVVSQTAGIRPTVIDRRPLLGEHPTQRGLYVLNGLGTRGVMLGATMAQQLYAHIQNKTPLDNAVSIARFY